MKALVLCAALAAGPALAEGTGHFGYAAVECGVDDIFTPDVVEDGYAAEVAAFSNLNMACVDAMPTVTAQRIRRLADTGGEVLLNVQAALFEMTDQGLRPSPARALLWPLVTAGIAESGVDPARIVLYLVDEPTLNRLPPQALDEALHFVRQSFPAIRTMAVEARIALPATIPEGLSYWGFSDYFLRDPAQSPDYMAALDRSVARLGPDQGFVMVMDATHFWLHAERGFDPEDMAQVAQAYADLALSREDIAVVMAYSWVGGIDDASERGVRDLPPVVAQTHRAIGRALLGR